MTEENEPGEITEMDHNTSEVSAMIRAMASLENVSEIDQSSEYKHVVQLIRGFLDKHCQHTYIIDYIDLGLEKTIPIFFCQYCYKLLESDDPWPPPPLFTNLGVAALGIATTST